MFYPVHDAICYTQVPLFYEIAECTIQAHMQDT